MVRLIATHNSGTGEPSDGWLSRLVVPFSRCQSLNLAEQYANGVRYFDLRVKKVYGTYYIAHGLWCSSTTLAMALMTLNRLAIRTGEQPYAMITYEGSLDTDSERTLFVREVKELVAGKQVCLTEINVKLPEWTLLEVLHPLVCKQAYAKIVGWKCLLPVPWLWWFFGKPVNFSENYFTMIDFAERTDRS